MTSRTFDLSDFSPLEPVSPAGRPDRARFKLACPIRLVDAGRPLGEFRTIDINCESLSCLLPETLATGPVRCGDLLECEIDLPGTVAPVPQPPLVQLRGQLQAIRVTNLDAGIAEVCFRLLSYEIA